MKLVELKDVFASPEDFADREISVGGWVRTLRNSGSFAFVELNDGTYFKPLQVVLEAATLPNYAEAVKINVGASPAAHQHLQRGLPREKRRGLRHPQVLPGARLRLRAHSPDHRERLRRRG